MIDDCGNRRSGYFSHVGFYSHWEFLSLLQPSLAMSSLRLLHGRGMNSISDTYILPADVPEHDVRTTIDNYAVRCVSPWLF